MAVTKIYSGASMKVILNLESKSATTGQKHLTRLADQYSNTPVAPGRNELVAQEKKRAKIRLRKLQEDVELDEIKTTQELTKVQDEIQKNRLSDFTFGTKSKPKDKKKESEEEEEKPEEDEEDSEGGEEETSDEEE